MDNTRYKLFEKEKKNIKMRKTKWKQHLFCIMSISKRWKRTSEREKKKRERTLLYVAIGPECQLLTTLNIHASYDILEHKSLRMRG